MNFVIIPFWYCRINYFRSYKVLCNWMVFFFYKYEGLLYLKNINVNFHLSKLLQKKYIDQIYIQKKTKLQVFAHNETFYQCLKKYMMNWSTYIKHEKAKHYYIFTTEQILEMKKKKKHLWIFYETTSLWSIRLIITF